MKNALLSPRMVRAFTSEDLAEAGVSVIKHIVDSLVEEYAATPQTCLKPLWDSTKYKIAADESAERDFRKLLRKHKNGHFKDVDVFGEENLDGPPIDLHEFEGTCVLVDALDGSDLYERGLSNWCSAATFCTPKNEPGKRIRAAVVGLPDGSVYYATDNLRDPVFVKRSARSIPTTVRGLSKVTSLAKASICFYGQKLGGLLETLSNQVWRNIAAGLPAESKKSQFRIYNLGGIPMLTKLIDKVSPQGAGIDAVIELRGQKAHDVVPGAFLAKRAGADVIDSNGEEITYQKLEEVMLKPNTEKLSYIISATKELSAEILHNFSAK